MHANENAPYSTGEASRDGIGKFYMDREISKVMGHLGAGWLERPQREQAGTHRFTGRKLEPSDHLTMWST